MADTYLYRPPRRWGLAYHLLTVMLLTAVGSLGLLQASLAAMAPAFLLFVLPAVPEKHPYTHKKEVMK